MSRNVVGHEAAELGLVRLEEQQLRRRDRLERARDSRAARERARLHRRLIGDAVVGVERVARSVAEDQLRLELADQAGQPLDGGGIHDERVVAEVEAAEVRAEEPPRRSPPRAWRISFTRSSVWPASFQSSPDSPRSP